MTYLLVVDDELWRKFKAKCALEDIKIKNILVDLIEKWVEEPKKSKK